MGIFGADGSRSGSSPYISNIQINNALIKYIAKIVNATRKNKSLYLGASPRASIALLNGAKALAAIHGRNL